MSATRDDFLRQAKRRTATFEHAELGTIHVRSLTERERSEIKVQLTKATKNKSDYIAMMADEQAWVVCYALCDADGDRLFSNADIEAIKDMDGGLIAAIYEEIDKLCEVSFLKENGRVEESAKNLPGTGDDASQLDSPISLVS